MDCLNFGRCCLLLCACLHWLLSHTSSRPSPHYKLAEKTHTCSQEAGSEWGSWIILAQIYSHVLATTTRTLGLAVWVSLAGDQQNPCFFLSCPACCLSFSPRSCLSSLHLQTPDGSKFFRFLSISDLQLNPHSGTAVTALSISLLRHFIRQTSKCVQ